MYCNDVITEGKFSNEKSLSDQRIAFVPLCLISDCKELETLKTRLTDAIILPFRVEIFSVHVSPEGNALELTVTRPTPLFF